MNGAIDLKIPGYRIEKLLGKGGMATVYLATQMSLGRPVALKILNDPETPQFFERFFNEGRCISRLNHPNLVTIFDIGQGDGFYYIAMEYIPGCDLKALIVQGIKPGNALKILARMASCLSYVHGEGVVHRDIKPSNILFRNDGTPVLTDFGIAKLIQADNDLTVTGTVMGSPHYLSPEQAQGARKIDGRSDLYGLGVILFEMLTGRKPYTAESFAATLMAHIERPVPQLPEKLSALQPLIHKLMAKDPADRFQSGAELAKSIQQYRTLAKRTRAPSGAANTATKSSESKQNRFQPLLLPVIMLGILGITALPSLWSEQNPDTEEAVTSYIAVESPKAINEKHPIKEPLAEQPMTNKPADQPPGTETEALSEPVAINNKAEKPHTDPVDKLLAEAHTKFKKDQLSYPAGDSAKDLYRNVLKLDPTNKAAQQGLDQIANRYYQLALDQAKRGNKIRAQRYITQGLSIRSNHQKLKSLQSDLSQPSVAGKAPGDKKDFDWSILEPTR